MTLAVDWAVKSQHKQTNKISCNYETISMAFPLSFDSESLQPGKLRTLGFDFLHYHPYLICSCEKMKMSRGKAAKTNHVYAHGRLLSSACASGHSGQSSRLNSTMCALYGNQGPNLPQAVKTAQMHMSFCKFNCAPAQMKHGFYSAPLELLGVSSCVVIDDQ